MTPLPPYADVLVPLPLPNLLTYATEGVDEALEIGMRVVVQLRVVGETRVSQRPFSSEILELFLLDTGQIREIRPFYWDPSALA